MSDEVETMAYAGEPAWHGLGFKVSNDLSPVQMMEAAKCNWDVIKVPAFAKVDGKKLDIGKSALVRSTDNRILDVVSPGWEDVSNLTAFEFFNDFVAAGEMQMHTAGSLREGQVVWALAKVNDGFDLFKGKDQIDLFMLFSNWHKWGNSTSVSMTPIRVVCMNTLNMSLAQSQGSDKIVRVNHSNVFNSDVVKETLGVSKKKLAQYKECAVHLSKTKASTEDVIEYLTRLFPVHSAYSKKEMSKAAAKCLELVNTQPGAELGQGTFWQAFNAVTYFTDHVAGRTTDTRLSSAWYGTNRRLKMKALKLALEYAG